MGAETRTEGGRKRHTTFASTSDTPSVFFGEDARCQVPGPVVRGIDVMALGVAHLIKFFSELPCLLSLAVHTPSLTHLEEIMEVGIHGERIH